MDAFYAVARTELHPRCKCVSPSEARDWKPFGRPRRRCPSELAGRRWKARSAGRWSLGLAGRTVGRGPGGAVRSRCGALVTRRRCAACWLVGLGVGRPPPRCEHMFVCGPPTASHSRTHRTSCCSARATWPPLPESLGAQPNPEALTVYVPVDGFARDLTRGRAPSPGRVDGAPTTLARKFVHVSRGSTHSLQRGKQARIPRRSARVRLGPCERPAADERNAGSRSGSQSHGLRVGALFFPVSEARAGRPRSW